AGGARECRLVGSVEEARALAATLPGAVISAEIDGYPVPGIAISNSPTQVRAADLRGRCLVQRTSSGTQAVVAANAAQTLYAASLVVASATARALEAAGSGPITLVATGEDRGHPEDRACALYLESLLRHDPADVETLLAPLRASARWEVLQEGGWPGFPVSDLDLALVADRFPFALRVRRDHLGHCLTAEPA
ncbi:MAG: 2-phosphosulfolactate phosphatase, partial [Candidatus Dormibacteraeota bacterium]|nr:2-phosphosulfolactate phosphatase [Candidatus Dormibacteraeota bacterium]